jgi:ribose-phosphate pyrophosphokinase
METISFTVDGREILKSEIIKVNNSLCKDGCGELDNGLLNKQKFSDGELCVDFKDSVRGKRVYIITSPNTSDEIINLEMAIDAAKRAAASEVIPILPYFPYARQDKKDQSRGPIGAKVMALKLEAIGATSLVTFDLHADQIQGFFEIPVTHIEGKNIFSEYIANIANENTILFGPDEEIILSSCDAGGVKRVKRMATKLKEKFSLDINYIVIDKIRDKANSVESVTIIGNVKNKHVIIVDDMIDTFGSADKSIDALIDGGAKSVRMIASHGVLSGSALDKIAKSKLTELIISDSLELKIPENHPVRNKIKVISLATQIGYALQSINSGSSLEKILGK